MKVALDLEDVLVKNVRVFIEELNKFVEENHSLENRFSASDIEGWKFKGLREEFADLRGWNEDITNKFMYGDENGWRGFYPITEEIWKNETGRISLRSEDIVEEVKRIREIVDGEIIIVTARENVDSYVKEKIKELGLEDIVDGLVFKSKKDKLDFDMCIDDYPKLYQKLDERVQIMISQPWNEDENLERPNRRVENLKKARKVIQDVGTKV